MTSHPEREPHKEQRAIRALFAGIARDYDRVNRILSLGQDQRWRDRALALTALPSGGRLLDVATGTGDVALLAKRRRSDIEVVGLDLTESMVHLAREKVGGEAVHWQVGDGLALPFPADTFDAAISAFMLRNVPDVTRALAEQRRVVRPGGRVVCLEMSWPRRFPMSWLFRLYFFSWAPLVGKVLTGEGAAYRYLPRSVRRFMEPERLAQTLARVGLNIVHRETLMMGTVALLAGEKPEMEHTV